jgi:hypothetical protein
MPENMMKAMATAKANFFISTPLSFDIDVFSTGGRLIAWVHKNLAWRLTTEPGA